MGRAGLTSAEVAERRARGEVNDAGPAPTRTLAQILRANVFTRFNLLLGSLLLVILIVGPLNDALFGGVLVANTLIGIVQELRAKRTLDRLAVLNAPRARVRRDGVTAEVAVEDVVRDDLVELRAGDQVVVDGEVVESEGLELDESLLTGESDPLHKEVGDEVLSGSVVVAGTGALVATKIGRESYAVRLADEARRFSLVRSELRTGIDRVVTAIGWVMLPIAAVLLWSQWSEHDDDWREAARSTVGGVVAMVPEGLVLLTSMAFAAGVLRLGRRRALVQELAAVETLARVDVLCVDKTGTITTGQIRFDGVVPLDGASEDDARRVLASMAAGDPNPNPTLLALRAAHDHPVGASVAVPFSSARKWSAARLQDGSTWVLGAPELLLPPGEDGSRATAAAVAEHTAAGRRVVLLAEAPGLDGEVLPPRLAPVALALLEDEIRAEAPDTLRWFAQQGVSVKIISGDHPATVTAVARRAGVDVSEGIDARELGEDPDALQAALERGTVFGRVTPHQKRAMVKALQRGGHVVAMTGDGVNDVLALKDADMGIAMGSGSEATRATAQVVLLDSSFASLPAVVAEGRRVIANIERVARLFLTKTVYALTLALAVGVATLPFPFLPRHLTLVGSLTIGIPAFFLALAPNEERASPGFVGRVLRFAAPAGLVAAAATLTGYAVALEVENLSRDESRTTATIVLVTVGLFTLARLARPLVSWRLGLVAAMAGAVVAVMLLPAGREFFALELPPGQMLATALVTAALAGTALWVGDALVARRRRAGSDLAARPADSLGA